MAGKKTLSDNFELYGSIVADRVKHFREDFTITAAFVEAEASGIRLIE